MLAKVAAKMPGVFFETQCSYRRTVVEGLGLHFSESFSVCGSVFFARYLKTAAAGIAKLDIEMCDHDAWKLIYFGVKRSNVKVTRHKNSAGRLGFLHSCECWLIVVIFAVVHVHQQSMR